MNYTGKIIIIEQDTNPNSSTYGQTRTREEISDLCDTKPLMNLISEYDLDGVDYEDWQDINEYSPTYLQIITIEKGNTNPLKITYKSECVQVLYNEEIYGNNGIRKNYNIDINPYSTTYRQIDYTETEDLLYCTLPDKTPEVGESYLCELETIQSIQVPNGNKRLIKTDINPYSDTYRQVLETVIIEDIKTCTPPDKTPNLKTYCSMCEAGETGYKITYFQDLNIFSPTYTKWGEYIMSKEESDDCKKIEDTNTIYFNANFEPGETPYILTIDPTYNRDNRMWERATTVHYNWVEEINGEYKYKATVPDGSFPCFYDIPITEIDFKDYAFSVNNIDLMYLTKKKDIGSVEKNRFNLNVKEILNVGFNDKIRSIFSGFANLRQLNKLTTRQKPGESLNLYEASWFLDGTIENYTGTVTDYVDLSNLDLSGITTGDFIQGLFTYNYIKTLILDGIKINETILNNSQYFNYSMLIMYPNVPESILEYREEDGFYILHDEPMKIYLRNTDEKVVKFFEDIVDYLVNLVDIVDENFNPIDYIQIIKE